MTQSLATGVFTLGKLPILQAILAQLRLLETTPAFEGNGLSLAVPEGVGRSIEVAEPPGLAASILPAPPLTVPAPLAQSPVLGPIQPAPLFTNSTENVTNTIASTDTVQTIREKWFTEKAIYRTENIASTVVAQSLPVKSVFKEATDKLGVMGVTALTKPVVLQQMETDSSVAALQAAAPSVQHLTGFPIAAVTAQTQLVPAATHTNQAVELIERFSPPLPATLPVNDVPLATGIAQAETPLALDSPTDRSLFQFDEQQYDGNVDNSSIDQRTTTHRNSENTRHMHIQLNRPMIEQLVVHNTPGNNNFDELRERVEQILLDIIQYTNEL